MDPAPEYYRSDWTPPNAQTERVGEPEGERYGFEPASQQTIGAALEVMRQLGPGFREAVYQEALCIELRKRGIRYERQVEIPVYYEGVQVGTHVLDLVVEGTVVVELKAISVLTEVHRAQLVAYLRASNLRVGLLLNFGELPLGIRRVVNRHQR